MKRFLMTAAALTLGTSALAWAPAEKMNTSADTRTAKSEWSKAEAWSDKSMADGSAGLAKMASWASAGKLMAQHEEMVKLHTVSAGTGWDKVKLEIAEMDMAGKKDLGAQTASMEMKPGAEMGKETGMGGPLETADLTPRPAATGYPPCDPGPGDDSCIQLYEPGVRTALAQWKGSEGDVGMGGPYEPVAEDKEQAGDHSAMGHGSAATSEGKPPAPAESTTDTGTAVAKPVETGTAEAKPTGVGGPFEPATEYPPCRPGPGDDRCIQLYERGVTGRND